jgi:hypothetical protein
MRYYTVARAAKEIGVSDKTLRRWVTPDKTGKVKLASERTPSNRLKIAESDVLRLKQEVELEHSQFVAPEQELDTSEHIEALKARVEELEKGLAEVKEKVATLEQERVTELPVSTFATSAIDQIPRAQKRPTERNIEVPAELPAGTLPATDFAAKIGISYDHFKNYMKRGIYGQRLDITEIPHPTKKRADGQPAMQYFLTPEQQESVRALLAKHRKLPQTEE